MSNEIEAGAADAAGSFFRRKPKHALPLGSPCPNCAAVLEGPWCHACGQAAEEYHRSLVRLTAEALAGLVDVDGRLWRTLPDLVLRPARLTRSYLEGHRAPQAPPFRMFLIVVVLAFLAGGLGPQTPTKWNVADNGSGLSNGKGVKIHLLGQKGNDPFDNWVSSRLTAAAAHPEAFQNELVSWGQRLVLLALPMSAIMLGLMFFWRRGVYMFDHLIFSMHSLSFQGLLLSAVLLGDQVSGWFGMLLFASPVHLFAHLKGTYGIGVIGTLIRMLLLFVGSVFAFALLMSGLFFIGLVEVGP